ncbi:hypothetical protein [Skermanella pratensis]|uniref:hypothetical protein n=1 Tax=Skermanella pratensis TaxID=2233999 RepID=UPI001787ED5D|nr:hypothetical protein [Skermanella pratensis]
MVLLVATFSVAEAQGERATLRLEGQTVLRLSARRTLDARSRVRNAEARLPSLLERPEALSPDRAPKPPSP